MVQPTELLLDAFQTHCFALSAKTKGKLRSTRSILADLDVYFLSKTVADQYGAKYN